MFKGKLDFQFVKISIRIFWWNARHAHAKIDVPMNKDWVCEVYLVIRFLTSFGQIRAESHEQLKRVYGLKIMMAATVGREICMQTDIFER